MHQKWNLLGGYVAEGHVKFAVVRFKSGSKSRINPQPSISASDWSKTAPRLDMEITRVESNISI